MKWYIQGIRNYAKFSGRARFIEYWMFVLFNLIFCVIAYALDKWIAVPLIEPFSTLGEYTSDIGYISICYSLFILLPSISFSVRRLHDSGRSGLWWLISLIPILGWIVFLFLLLAKTEGKDNQYGPGPRVSSRNVADDSH